MIFLDFMKQPLMIARRLYKRLNGIVRSSDNKFLSEHYLKIRNLKRVISGKGKYSFISIDEATKWTTEWIKSFPVNYDIIVGVPRSGLFIASIIALKLGKPLTTPELFCRNLYWASQKIKKKERYKDILLVEDSACEGVSIKKNTRLLNSITKKYNITKASLIVTNKTKEFVDLYYKIIPLPRIFEWNLMHSKNMKYLVSDLDGVICENCPPGVDSDEKKYVKWTRNAKPYLIPNYEIDVILSNRLEKYRSETERWLAKHKVLYKKLILWNLQSKKERNNKYAHNKIYHILKIKPDFIFESNFEQARQIWRATKIPTLCISKMVLFN